MFKDLPLLLLCRPKERQVFGHFTTISQHDHTEHKWRGDEIMEDRIDSQCRSYPCQRLSDTFEVVVNLLIYQGLNFNRIGKHQSLRLRQILMTARTDDQGHKMCSSIGVDVFNTDRSIRSSHFIKPIQQQQ